MYTNGTWKTLSTISGTSYTASDLSQKTAYRFRVRAIRNYNYINYYGDYTEHTKGAFLISEHIKF